MRRANRKDMLNCNLTSTEVCRKDKKELFLRLVGGSLWVRDVTSCSLVWECLPSSDYTSLWNSAPLVANNGNQLQNSLKEKEDFLGGPQGSPRTQGQHELMGQGEHHMGVRTAGTYVST